MPAPHHGDLPVQIQGLAKRLRFTALERHHKNRTVIAVYVLINSAISNRFSQNVSASTESVDGVAVVVVRVSAPLPLLGPFGPDQELTVTGRAFLEAQ